MTSRIVANTAWLTVGEVVGRAIRVVLIVYAARIMGASEFGISSYALNLAVLFTLLTDLGLGAVLTKELVRAPERRHIFLSNLFVIKGLLLICAAIVIGIIIPLVSSIALSKALLISLIFLITFDSARLITVAVNRSYETMHKEAFTNIATQCAILVLGFIAVWYAPSAEYLNIAYAIGSGIGTTYGFWLIRKHLSGVSLALGRNRPLITKMLTDAWPLAVVGVLGGIMLATDTVMLGWFRTAEEIGYYSAAQKIIFTLYILPTLVSSAVFPSMTRLVGLRIEFRNLFEKALGAVVYIAFPLMIGGVILSEPIIRLFYGAEYMPAVLTLQILFLTLVTNFPTTVIGNAIFAHDQQTIFIKYALLGTLGNALLNLLLIPHLGIEGSALATLVTQTITTGFIWQKMKTIHVFSINHYLPRILIATLIMAGAVYSLVLLTTPLGIIIPFAALLYFSILFLLKDPFILSLLRR